MDYGFGAKMLDPKALFLVASLLVNQQPALANESVAIESQCAPTPGYFEQAHQYLYKWEMPLYLVYFVSNMPQYHAKYREGKLGRLDFISSMVFLGWTARMHASLYLGTIVESFYLPSPAQNNLQDKGTIDWILAKAQEIMMPGYGAQVVTMDACVQSGLCAPQNGQLEFYFEYYFPALAVLTAGLQNVRDMRSNVTAQNSTQAGPVSLIPFGDYVGSFVNSAYLLGSVCHFYAAKFGKDDPRYQSFAFNKALSLVFIFLWWGADQGARNLFTPVNETMKVDL
uniref:Uncharacterized protein n=1 Tax=uncultured bacterium Ak20-3 TaxID=798570 RepID=D9MX64_9BACT|nr:hypothetical protein AKSOIL_0333 [uncultured bacterium Ak20-3]